MHQTHSLKNHKELFIDAFVLLCFFIIISVPIWISIFKMNYYPSWDESHHLAIAYLYYKALNENNLQMFLSTFQYSETIYPPLYHILCALIWLVFGVNAKIAIAINIPFLYGIGLATYLLARLSTNRLLALVAGSLTFLVPLFIELGYDAMTDIASIALFLLFYFAVLKTSYFKSRFWTIIAGILGMLTIFTRYSIFSPALPLVYYCVISLYKNRFIALRNICIACVFAIPLLYWYIPHWNFINTKLTFFADPTKYPFIIYNVPKLTDFSNWVYYLRSSIGSQGIGLLPIISFIFLAITKSMKDIRFINLYLLSIFINIFVQTIWLDKIPKYICYSYPFILILIVSTLSKKSLTVKILVLATILSMVLNYYNSILNIPNSKPLYKLTNNIFILSGIKYQFTNNYWPIDDLTKNIVKTSSVAEVLFLPDHYILNQVSFIYYSQIMNSNLSIHGSTDLYDPVKYHEITENEIINYDYIITKTGSDAGVFVNMQIHNQINQLLLKSKKFSEYMRYSLPDNSEVLVYRRLI